MDSSMNLLDLIRVAQPIQVETCLIRQLVKRLGVDLIQYHNEHLHNDLKAFNMLRYKRDSQTSFVPPFLLHPCNKTQEAIGV